MSAHPALAHTLLGLEETDTCRMPTELGQNFWQYDRPPMLQPDVQSPSQAQLPLDVVWRLTFPHQREKRPSTGPEELLPQSPGQLALVSPPLQAPSPQ